MDQIEQKDLQASYKAVAQKMGIVGIVTLITLLLLKWFPIEPVPTNISELKEVLATHSSWSPLIFIGFYTMATAFGFPGTPITIAGGAIFGTSWGILLNTIGSNLGANLSFLIARKLGRTTLQRICKYDLGVYGKTVSPQDLWKLFSLRLFPLVPFTALNFACGFSNLSWRTYTLGTIIGMLPWTILYTIFADTALHAYQAYSLSVLSRLLLLVILIFIFLKIPVFFREDCE